MRDFRTTLLKLLMMLLFLCSDSMTAKDTLSAWDRQEILKYYSLGYSKKKAEKYQKAISYFDEALKIDPQLKTIKPKVFYFKAQCYEELEDIEMAIKQYELYLKIEPEHNITLIKLEYLYLTKSRFEKAIKINKQLFSISNDPLYMKKIANIYVRKAVFMKNEGHESMKVKRNFKFAVIWYEDYMEYVPDDKEVENLIKEIKRKHF